MRRTLTLPAVVATALTLAFLLSASPARADELTDRIQQTKDNNDKNDRAMRERNDSLLSRSRNDSLDRTRARAEEIRAAGTSQNGGSPSPDVKGYLEAMSSPRDAARYAPAPRATIELFFPESLIMAFNAGNIVAGDHMYIVALSSPSGITLGKCWGRDAASVRKFYAKQSPTQQIVAIGDSGFVVAP